MQRSGDYDATVVGGGLYGCLLAIHRRGLGERVLLLEREPEVLRRASYANQARVHNGYHYPRSFLTALRSRVNYPRFMSDYADCVEERFESYYAIARVFSNVTAAQFALFCERIKAPVAPAPPAVRRLFDPRLIEQIFSVTECVFDAVKLRNRIAQQMDAAGVEVLLETEALRVEPAGDDALDVVYGRAGDERRARCRGVYNCTYARTNKLLVDSGLAPIPLKHELAEMALVEVPAALRNVAVTTMCGPFFSLVPFAPRGLHTFSHVRYTPHHEWYDEPGAPYRDPYEYIGRIPKRTNYPHMIQDARRYLPLLAECRYRDSLWEVKSVLPMSEVDDSRPILLRPAGGLPRLTSIMGSKIDNVYDVIETLAAASAPLAGAR